jgi:hypothetical protein
MPVPILLPRALSLVVPLVLGLQLCLPAAALAAEDGKNFSLEVDGQEIGISPGDTITASTKSGGSVTIKLARREFNSFRTDRIGFEHLSKLAVASTDISKDIRQHLMTTGRGTLVIVQEYTTLDPGPLAQLMLSSMVRDDIAAGAKLTDEPAKRKLADGTEMSGLKAKIVGKNDAATLEVMTLGKDDQGIIVVTRIDAENIGNDQVVLDRFWRSLRFRTPAP